MNPTESTLNRPGDNKTHSRADIRSKWTPLSLQGELFITTIFWIPDGSPLQVRLRVTENLLAIILIAHNSPNRRVRQPLCNSKNFQDAG